MNHIRIGQNFPSKYNAPEFEEINPQNVYSQFLRKYSHNTFNRIQAFIPYFSSF